MMMMMMVVVDKTGIVVIVTKIYEKEKSMTCGLALKK